MKIYPVIDIKGGKCVRTRQGKYYDVEVYSHFPEKIAVSLESQGASYLHVIDLDRSVLGHAENEECIEKIIENVSIPVQVGGGIRTIKDIDQKLRLGAARVVIGSEAAKNPAFIKEAIHIFGADKLVVSMDLKNNEVMMDGWANPSAYNALAFAKMMEMAGLKTIIYTDVDREGMLQGANIGFARMLIQETKLDVIVSGGITSMIDLEMLEEAGVEGVLVGKSLYEHRIDLASAMEHFGSRTLKTK